MLCATGIAIAASAPPVAAAAPGPYGGSASADLIHVTALDVPNTFTLADLAVAPARSQVLSTGIGGGAPRSSARATNLDVGLLQPAIPSLPGLLVDVSQTAPPDNAQPAAQTLVPLPLDPIANIGVGTASARARWVSDTECVPPGTPIATSRSSLADVKVLTLGTSLPGGSAGTSLLSLVNGAGGTVFTDTATSLFDTGGGTAGLRSTATTQVTGVVLFAGTANQVTINVLAPPTVTAEASGQPGGAKVTYTAPVLQVTVPGGQTFTLDAATANQTLDIPALLHLELGTLTKTEAADGTSASGQADLLRITLLTNPLPLTAADISIAAGSVSAQVPSGGISCDNSNPLRETHKDLSAVQVAPGKTFNYTVTVPNRGSCTLTGVSIVDTVSGPSGASIVSTDPPGTVDGLNVTWQVDQIAPNETKSFQIVVKAPPTAGGSFSNHVDATGTCNGNQVTQPADVSGPQVVAPAGNGCRLSTSNKAASHLEVVPGETFNYYIHVFNSGNGNCTSVQVADTLQGPLDFVSCSDGCTQAGQQVSWSLDTLAAGQSRTLVITVRVHADAQQGQHLPDDAKITSGSGGSGPGADVHTDGPAITGQSVLAPPSPAGAGGPMEADTLPRTGRDTPWVAVVALAVGLGLAGVRRRLRATG